MMHLADEDVRTATGRKTFGAAAAAEAPEITRFYSWMVGQGG